MVFNSKNLKLAIQKEGRLTEETLAFLRRCGLEFEDSRKRLFSSCRNFPLEILYLRHDDIPNYVESGIVDLGIIGQNILFEKRPIVKKLLNLRFSFCSLVIAAPQDSKITSIDDLQNKTIATSYPFSTQEFLKKNRIEAKVIQLRGSLEITPALGIADAIADLTSTGKTLALNDLRVLAEIYASEAVLIANGQTLVYPSYADLHLKLTSTVNFKCQEQLRWVDTETNRSFFSINSKKDSLETLLTQFKENV